MFYALKYNLGTTTFRIEKPWEWQPPAPLPQFKDKEEFRKWCALPTTDHAFISGFEGMTPEVRVSDPQGNRAVKQYHFTADYDGPFDPVADVAKILKRPPGEFLPAYVSQTFSGHCRAVWNIQAPVWHSENPKHQVEFLRIAQRQMKLKKWFINFDEPAFLDPKRYYEIGRNWTPVKPDAFVPTAVINLWMYEAATKVQWSKAKVEIARVAEEVESKFPGRWKGPFAVGARGCRFWDPSAEDQTMCVVMEDGCYVFNADPKPFMTWADIFGASFMENAKADKLAPILDHFAYDGRAFWERYEGENALWRQVSKEDMTQYLNVQGVNRARPKGDPSEIDKVEVSIKRDRVVDQVGPFIHMPPGIFIFQGRRTLNISRDRMIQPAPEGTVKTWSDGDTYFPLIKSFLQGFWAEGTHQGMGQLEWGLAWMAHMYVNALEHDPQPGQALFNMGKEGIGKNFFSRALCGTMMGGYYDAADYLVDGSTWTDRLAEAPILSIEDALATSDPKKRARCEALIKKITANQMLNVNGKFKALAEVRWVGRTVVGLNDDDNSRLILPTMDISNQTKVSLLMCAPKRPKDVFQFPNKQSESEAILRKELPYFCRFLIEYYARIPDVLINHTDNRYYLRPYHHPEIYRYCVQSGASYGLFEMLLIWIGEYRKSAAGETSWEGTATDLYRLLSVTEGLGPLVSKLNHVSLGRALGTLSARGYRVNRIGSGSGAQKWQIPFDLGTVDPDGGTSGSGEEEGKNEADE